MLVHTEATKRKYHHNYGLSACHKHDSLIKPALHSVASRYGTVHHLGGLLQYAACRTRMCFACTLYEKSPVPILCS